MRKNIKPGAVLEKSNKAVKPGGKRSGLGGDENEFELPTDSAYATDQNTDITEAAVLLLGLGTAMSGTLATSAAAAAALQNSSVKRYLSAS